MSKVRNKWSEESMVAAVGYVKEGNGLREASRLYNIPVETLRRRVTGVVDILCKPGPSTVLTSEEEDRLVVYAIEMADRGFGLTPDDLMKLAYTIADKSGRPHPFRNGIAGRGWLEGFRKRHREISLRSPQSLSFCRAVMASKSTVEDLFTKLGGIYGRLNLLSKPMQVYNIDETGVTIVHKPGKVISEVGRKHVYSLTSCERGKTHTVVACISASGIALPPLMIYPRKKEVPETMRAGAVPGSMFRYSDNGWITQAIYLEWFRYFIQVIPPARPVLLIEDGHASHIGIEVIELARENDVHLLCLPAHTSHILQPLDIGVFQSFKSNYSKACRKYILDNPGRVVTAHSIAGLVGEAWPRVFTPINIMSGFKKSGIYPFNPGEVSDRMLAPAKAVRKHQGDETCAVSFSEEKVALFQRRFEEGYNICDPEYTLWLKQAHPDSSSNGGSSATPVSSSDTGDRGSLETNVGATSNPSVSSAHSSSRFSLSNVLVLPEPEAEQSKRKRKPALNSKAVCISDFQVLEKLKEKEQQKAEAKHEQQLRKAEREERRRQRLEQKKKKVDKGTKKKDKASLEPLSQLENLQLSDDECPKCHLDVDCQWICCDSCDIWYHMHCTNVSPDSIPDIWYCENCV
jgi:hypothetical protein